MGNCPFSPPNKSRNVNRDWIPGYSIGRDIDNISDGMLPLTVHKIELMTNEICHRHETTSSQLLAWNS